MLAVALRDSQSRHVPTHKRKEAVTLGTAFTELGNNRTECDVFGRWAISRYCVAHYIRRRG